MFTTITWSTYFAYVALACCAWYLFIAMRYYPYEIRSFVLRKFSREQVLIRPSLAPQPDPDTRKDVYAAATVPNTDQLSAVVESLSIKLEDIVRESSSKGYSKEEFLFLLQLTLKELPELNVPRHHGAIKTLVTNECEKFGFPPPGSEELDMLLSETKPE